MIKLNQEVTLKNGDLIFIGHVNLSKEYFVMLVPKEGEPKDWKRLYTGSLKDCRVFAENYI